MAAHPRFSPRLLIPLVWRCRLGHGAWRDDPSRLPKTPRDPQARRRSSDPKPCAGLLHPPRCAAGAPGTAPGPRPPGRHHPASPARADASAPARRPPLLVPLRRVRPMAGGASAPCGLAPPPGPARCRGRRCATAQVVQTRRRQRLVEGAHRGVGGTTAAGEQGLSACGWQSHPAMGERRPRRQRQRGAALRRRRANWGPRAPDCPSPACSCRRPTTADGHTRGGVRPWASRAPPRDGRGAGGRARPPALAAGRTNPVGSRREGWRCREPPWPQPPAGLQPRAGGGWGW